MAKNVSDFVDQYTDPESYFRGPQMRGISIKVNMEAMILLEAMSAHVGKKKTPLMGELAEAAIHQAFELMSEDMDPELHREIDDRMQKEVQDV